MHHCLFLLAICTVAVCSLKELGDFRPRPGPGFNGAGSRNLGPIVISGIKVPLARDPSRTIGPIVILPGTARPMISKDPSRTIGPIVIRPGPKITGTKATALVRDPSRTIGPIVIMPGTSRPKH